MNLSSIPTRTLVEEVLRRCNRVDTILDLARNTEATVEDGDAPPTNGSCAGRPRGSTRLRNEDIVAVMRSAGRAMTTYEIAKKIPRATSASVGGHIRRGVLAGKIEQKGTERPYAYQLTA